MNGGYPTDDDIRWIKKELNKATFFDGAFTLEQFFELIGHGRVRINEAQTEVVITTGGWSGCEEVMAEIKTTLWYRNYWQSIHRGGMEIFGTETD